MQCFFCKNFGHFKKECRIYQSYLKKQKSKTDNFNGQGPDGKTTHPSPKKKEKLVYGRAVKWNSSNVMKITLLIVHIVLMIRQILRVILINL